MATYSTMQSRIADEIARADLTSNIQSAILSTIQRWERRRFHFNETTGTFVTVASQEYYSSSDFADLANLVEIDLLRLTYNNTYYDLNSRTMGWIDEHLTASTDTGPPTDYVHYKQNFRLYPIPDAAYTVTVSYVKKFTALSSGTDSNAWTNDAEELVRCGAMADLYGNVIMDYEKEARWRGKETDAYLHLLGQTVRQTSSGFIVPTRF